jgi:hypothetical protein
MLSINPSQLRNLAGSARNPLSWKIPLDRGLRRRKTLPQNSAD